MKLLLDENLSDRIVPRLADLYPGSTRIKSVGLREADGSTVWDWAKRHEFTKMALWDSQERRRIRRLMNVMPTHAATLRSTGRRIRGSFFLALGLFIVLALSWEPLQAATQPDLPSALALFERHIEAIGGAAALRQAQSLTFKGELSLPFLKAKAPIEFLFQAPDRYYCQFHFHYPFFGFLKVPLVGVREAECGYDGTNGWDVNFEHQVEPLGAIDEAFFRGLLDKFSPLCFHRDFPLTRTLDIQQFANRQCYRVMVVFPFGDHAFEFYDINSGKLAGTIYPFEAGNEMVNVEATYSDFRRVSQSLQLPFRIDLRVGDQSYLIQGTELSADTTSARIPRSKLKSPPPPPPLLKPATKPAREIIDHCVTARGGGEALRHHTSLHVSGAYGVPGAKGFTNRMDVFSAPPNRFSFVLPTPKGLYREGCDGEHYWKADGGDIRFLSGSELTQKTNEIQFLADLYPPGAFRSLETLGSIRLNGRECYQVLLARANGEMFDEFYDVETGFLRARRTNDERTAGAVKLLATFDDYRRFGDWMLSTHDSYRLFNAPQVVTITNVEWDSVPDSVFAMPADVKSRAPAQ